MTSGENDLFLTISNSFKVCFGVKNGIFPSCRSEHTSPCLLQMKGQNKYLCTTSSLNMQFYKRNKYQKNLPGESQRGNFQVLFFSKCHLLHLPYEEVYMLRNTLMFTEIERATERASDFYLPPKNQMKGWRNFMCQKTSWRNFKGEESYILMLMAVGLASFGKTSSRNA